MKNKGKKCAFFVSGSCKRNSQQTTNFHRMFDITFWDEIDVHYAINHISSILEDEWKGNQGFYFTQFNMVGPVVEVEGE